MTGSRNHDSVLPWAEKRDASNLKITTRVSPACPAASEGFSNCELTHLQAIWRLASYHTGMVRTSGITGRLDPLTVV